MQLKTYNPATNAVNEAQALTMIKSLASGEYAISHLPPDTKFALAIEGIEKDINASFAETDVTIMPEVTGGVSNPGVGAGLQADMSPEGLVGRFMGYLALTDTKFRIYRAVDLDSTKMSFSDAVNKFNQPHNLELLYEDNIANISSSMQAFKYVLSGSQKKYKLVTVFKINHTEGRFESSFGGLQGGLKPLFKYMNQHGGQLKFSQKNNLLTVIVIVVVLAFAALLLLKKS
jgi:hypothetical protein